MELIKALLTLISVLFRLPVALVKRYLAEREWQQEKEKQKEFAVQYLLKKSMVSFYEFLLTREELDDDDIRYLLNEHEKHELKRLRAEAAAH